MVTIAFSALADPKVLDAVSPRPGEHFDPETFLRNNGTVYLLGTSTGVSATAGLVGAFVEDVVEAARRIAARSPASRLDPPLSLILDEAANYPLPSLPSLMSDGGGSGLSTIVVLQSLAQARAVWGENQASAIWDAAIVKTILGGGSNARDLEDLSKLHRSTRRANHLQQPRPGRAPHHLDHHDEGADPRTVRAAHPAVRQRDPADEVRAPDRPDPLPVDVPQGRQDAHGRPGRGRGRDPRRPRPPRPRHPRTSSEARRDPAGLALPARPADGRLRRTAPGPAPRPLTQRPRARRPPDRPAALGRPSSWPGSTSTPGSSRPAGSATTAWSKPSKPCATSNGTATPTRPHPSAAVDWFRGFREIEARLTELAAMTSCTAPRAPRPNRRLAKPPTEPTARRPPDRLVPRRRRHLTRARDRPARGRPS